VMLYVMYTGFLSDHIKNIYILISINIMALIGVM
jgi:hypothetical protein